MRTPRVAIGITLIAAGTAAALTAARAVVGDRARAEAALLVAETLGAREQAAQQERAEQAAAAAARIEPLAAALRAHVDGVTLVDLFDNEDWWRPYHEDFPVVRVTDGDRLLAARGPDVGHAADPVVASARQHPVASTVVKLGGQSYVVASTAIQGLPGGLILTLARPFTPPAAAPTFANGPAPSRRSIAWGAALALGLGGLGLVFSGRRAVAAVPTNLVGSAPARPVAAVPGAEFGRYRLIDRLGGGGMSELFIAEAAGVEGFTRTFVLKRLRPELARDKEAVAQFIDEARLQAGLVHSNIVPVFDFGVVSGEYFLTQEYILGRDLARLVGRYGDQHDTGLPEAMAYYIAHETLQALAYAHDKRDKTGAPMEIVHRDVSAGNVMVSLLGEVKLGDFGIVKSNRSASRTQVGLVKGNASFMSPEQARGQPVDHRSDLFSLGHVLHYCLTGCLIYDGENDLDVLHRAAGGLTEEDLAAVRQLPEPAASVLARALAFDPDRRFQTAVEFADALAPHAGAGKAATAKLMLRLFGDELRRQTGAAAGAV